MWSRQQAQVTPVVPFKNKIQYYQLKQSFLITPYINEEKNKPLNLKEDVVEEVDEFTTIMAKNNESAEDLEKRLNMIWRSNILL
jgi:hypothetical protein